MAAAELREERGAAAAGADAREVARVLAAPGDYEVPGHCTSVEPEGRYIMSKMSSTCLPVYGVC